MLVLKTSVLTAITILLFNFTPHLAMADGPHCSDPDEDGWGWDSRNNRSCRSANLLFDHEDYDYVPAVMEEGNYQHFWWCGNEGKEGDDIFYRKYNLTNGTWSVPTVALSPTQGEWDSDHTCDPSVVKGRFRYQGTTYRYAMYYTAASNDERDGNNTGSGLLNGIGVAYSNNKVSWVKYHDNPILIQRPGDSGYGGWGVGQTSVVNANGRDDIWMWALQLNNGSHDHVWRLYYLSNSRNPDYRGTVSNQGLHRRANNQLLQADFAYNPHDHSVWVVSQRHNDTSRLDLYQASWNDHLSGNWSHKTTIDWGHTGNTINHGPGLVKNHYGNLPSNLTEVIFGSGYPNLGTWDLWWHVYSGSQRR